MSHAFGSIDELGEGYGFRKVRRALGVTAFGVNAIVYPPGYPGFQHFHETQDELYFVHARGARVDEVELVLGLVEMLEAGIARWVDNRVHPERGHAEGPAHLAEAVALAQLVDRSERVRHSHSAS